MASYFAKNKIPPQVLLIAGFFMKSLCMSLTECKIKTSSVNMNVPYVHKEKENSKTYFLPLCIVSRVFFLGYCGPHKFLLSDVFTNWSMAHTPSERKLI